MYKPHFKGRELQEKIKELDDIFLALFAKEFNLFPIRSPLFVEADSKINDGLNGETPVSFIPPKTNKKLEIVHSLAKWKRNKLMELNIQPYEGVYAFMNAIRQEEELDNHHSMLVDQFDWELVINEKDRNEDFLKEIVGRLYKVFQKTESEFNQKNPSLTKKLPDQITFVSSEELYNLYPNLAPNHRENKFIEKKKAAFIYKIGYKLPDGKTHSNRAFDYDDWELNGDLLFYDKQNQTAIELSSMGIRVDKTSLEKQLIELGKDKSDLGKYHENIINKKLPFTIGGGIGRSRLYMFFTESKHISEVQ